jgi:MoxR-like ATPase
MERGEGGERVSYGTFTGRGTPFYETTDEVAEVVNLAIALQKPLLVEGEAGCGKTQLAHAIAAELGLGKPIEIRIKSTTQAKDLLYRFDALRRLQDSQNERLRDKASSVYPYISLEPLGRAIQSGEPSVVLIDEVDKADIDFPNDLLDVLDQFVFDVDDLPQEESETCLRERGFGRTVRSRSGVKPIIVITSNQEKTLSVPFLRRCLYLEILFPDDAALLGNIVRKNLGASPEILSEALVGVAVQRFLEIRAKAKEVGANQKVPATSELIDWVRALTWRNETTEALAAGGMRPRYWRLLFKTMADLHAYEKETQ